MSGNLTAFTAGDLVVSEVGDVENNGTFSLDQASPIFLQELTTSGTVVGTMVLPQTTSVVNGTTEYAISGEYGSASEGALQLSADGQSLVILGYGVTSTAFNTGTIYGTNALGQTTSIPGGPDAVVPRIVADIKFNGSVDTSTQLFNVFNTNNPRSVATVNGTTFYVSGQGGGKGDPTQGVFVAHDGATKATAIDTSTDTRFVTIQNGQLYVSRDSTESTTSGTNISTYGTTLPTSATVPSVLPGISQSIILTAAQENTVNASAVGTAVNLSPESFFFATPSILYVADSGDPKNGGVGDGGLQKWVLNNGTWDLEYTLSQGLNIAPNGMTTSSGTSGLIGLTGTVIGGVVELFATTETFGELNPDALVAVTDTLTATTGTGEVFTTLETSAPNTILRGISFAPTQSATTPTSIAITSGVTSSGLVITSGSTLTVANGGTAFATTILSAGSAFVSSGGVDSGSNIAQGGSETVFGSAFGDFVGGTQLISGTSASTAVISNETVLNGGSVDLFLKGAVANNMTIASGGMLAINGNATASNTVIQGGTLEFQSPKANATGSLTFSGNGALVYSAVTSAGAGDLAVISNFGASDVVDFVSIGTGATFSTTQSGGNTLATVTSGAVSQTLTFAGSSTLQLTPDGTGGVEITFSAPPPTTATVASGVTSTGLFVTSSSLLDILSGGTAVATTVLSSGLEQVEIGGTDSATTLMTGGNELVFGNAIGDVINGTQLISAPVSVASSVAVVTNETVSNGGSVDLFLKGAVANGITVNAGGVFAINGNAVGNNTVINSGGLVQLQSPKATLSSSLTFSGPGTLQATAAASAGSGEQAVISNFSTGDVIDFTFIGSGASLSTSSSGGNTVASVTSNGVVQTAIFSGAVTSHLALQGDGTGGTEIVYTASATSSSTSTTPVSSGTLSNTVVSGGEILDVLSGAAIVSATVLSGGSAIIEVGATDSGSTISAGGIETVLGLASVDRVAGTQFINGNVVSETILSGGSATVEAGGADSGSVISAGGTETVSNTATGDQVFGTQVNIVSGAVVSNETVFNGGNVELFIAGAVGSGITVSSGGALTISGRGTAEATVLNGGSITLESPKATISGTLTFSNGAALIETATISPVSSGIFFGDQALNIGFGAGDVIAFTSTTDIGSAGSAATLTTSTLSGNTVATVSGVSGSESFTFAGTTIASQLGLVVAGGSVELTVVCFARGTRIRTPDGDVPIEQLAAGQAVVTASGETKPITWVGHRRLDCRRHPRPEQAWPVRIKAGAFGRGLPERDLLLSPQHAIFDQGVLVPIHYLINGTTVVQEPVAQVEYLHVELPTHDVLLAEGLPTESYLENGDRNTFENGGGALVLHPDLSRWNWDARACAALKVTGPEVQAIRAKLRRNARKLGRTVTEAKRRA